CAPGWRGCRRSTTAASNGPRIRRSRPARLPRCPAPRPPPPHRCSGIRGRSGPSPRGAVPPAPGTPAHLRRGAPRRWADPARPPGARARRPASKPPSSSSLAGRESVTRVTRGGPWRTQPEEAGMPESSAYDVIVIGSGAGGGTLVHSLAPSGKRILLLERGDYVRRERENWDARAVNVEGRYQTKEVWKDSKGRDLHPHTSYAVGGNTKFYGAALFRLRKEDFGELRHHGGLSPAWPISYDDLEPYYSRAERMYHVHGERGEDPTEPHASAPYPHPALSHE